MSDSVIAGLGGLLMCAAVWVCMSVPDLIDALVRRLRGPVRGCQDCGGRVLVVGGSTCLTCRDIRRERLRSDGASGAPESGAESDNAS